MKTIYSPCTYCIPFIHSIHFMQEKLETNSSAAFICKPYNVTRWSVVRNPWYLSFIADFTYLQKPKLYYLYEDLNMLGT